MNSHPTPHDLTAHAEQRAGLLHGFCAYAFWGMLPLYFKLLPDVSAFELVAHRIIWSVVFLAILLANMRLYPALTAALGQPRVIGALILSASLIAANWLAYVLAVASNHVVAASLG